jgi:hypothetical protein
MSHHDELAKEVQVVEDKIRDMSKRINDSKKQLYGFWRSLVGGQTIEMLKDIRSTEECLNDANHLVRYVALSSLLVDRKGQDLSQVAERVEYLSHSDPEEIVRLAAVGVLGMCHQGTNDKRIGCMLARIVISAGYSEKYRRSAYGSLCFLIDPKKRPRVASTASKTAPFRDSIDWDIVNLFLD